MRIVSLLPSATEIVYALGLGDQLVGVTHDCDFPADARTKARVSRTLLPPDATPVEIDRLVTAASVPGGSPTEVLDEDVLARLDPELIITQDLCAVCAIPTDDVQAALTTLGCTAEVVSLDPSSIDEVLAGISQVGAATRTDAEAAALVAGLRDRLDRVRASVHGLPRRRVFALEWGDPPFNGGHWIPEMIELAGGAPVLCEPGRDSVRVGWDQIAAAEADVVVFTPCGYSLDEAAAEGKGLLDRPEIAGAEVWAVDADSLFVRPGPRLVDGIEVLAALLHPDAVGPVPPTSAHQLR
ncbi:MAG: transporter substrate-binding protein [Actinomycetia bacterium]|nr:transporter substrate-binding protein [Actinomycetes bacterium]